MANVALTNYEINQQAYANIKPFTEEQIQKDLGLMTSWIEAYGNWEYLGILCRDKHDYTLVHTNGHFENTIQEMREILESRGEIVDIVYITAEDVYQVWVRERRTEAIKELEEGLNYKWTPTTWLYMVFDATDWVIEA